MRADPTITPVELPCYVTGRAVDSKRRLEVLSPYTGQLAGSVAFVDASALDDAIRSGGSRLQERKLAINRSHSRGMNVPRFWSVLAPC